MAREALQTTMSYKHSFCKGYYWKGINAADLKGISEVRTDKLNAIMRENDFLHW